MDTNLPPLMAKERKEKRKIVGATKVQQERLRKKEMQKAEDALDEIGQANEKKGIAAAKKAYQEYLDESFRFKTDRINWLNAKAKFSKRKIDYYRDVDSIIRYELSFLELPPLYTVKSEVTPRGIKLVLKDRWGTLHAGAFTPTGLGLYDEQACRSSVNKLDDAITFLEKHPPSGVYLS
jgi:hypothetical protein